MIFDLELPLKALGYISFRKINFPRIYPVFLTISVTEKCNGRCKTCNIWKKEPKNSLSLQEYIKIFKNIKNPYWITLSGGEPFIRQDFQELVISLIKFARPEILTIPTNGLLTDKILQDISKILDKNLDTKIVLNISLDSTKNLYKYLRGVKGYGKVMETYKGLKNIKDSNFVLGLHTVISKYNSDNFLDIFKTVQKLRPESYKIEIAENRKELDNIDEDIRPTEEKKNKIIRYLLRRDFGSEKPLARLISNLRKRYYLRLLGNKFEDLDCFAGFASCQISSTGKVWNCPVRADTLGDLRKQDYKFDKIWKSEKAKRIRKDIKDRECSCCLANAFYVNSLCNLNLFRFI